MSSTEIKKCLNCNNDFKRYKSHFKQVFCSKECREENKKNNKKAVSFFCNYCDKEFEQFPSHIRKHGCCSKECSLKWRAALTRIKNFHRCDNCDKPFIRNANGKVYKFCSSKCSEEFMIMDRSYSFKNGKTIDGNGYVTVLIERKKRKYEHRIIMEKFLCRKLNDNEVVHHKNRDKTDNRIENLELMFKADHDKLHLKEIRDGKKQ